MVKVKGEELIFGDYAWQILDVNKNCALIITKDIIGLQWYNNRFVDVTWENCSLRSYLNNDLYLSFNEADRKKIINVKNRNQNNPWFGTLGGNDTYDYIFLLSLEEVAKYFGDSNKNLQFKEKQRWLINDENNQNRQAKYKNEFHWWRLRSPGYYQKTSASINANGEIYVRGNGVFGKPKDGGGLRPALWIQLND